MNIKNIIKNNSILIVPNSLKRKIIKELNQEKEIYNTKIYTLNEFEKKLLFDYDEKTICYFIKKYNISYANSIEHLDNMKYLLEEKYDINKLINLHNIKKDLENNNLLIKDKLFLDYLKNKDIYFYGFDYINKFTMKLIDQIKNICNVNVVEKNYNNFKPNILLFKTLNEEIEFVANDIITKKLDLNKTYIYGINKDNKETIKRIFSNYNLPINIKNSDSLYDTKIGLNFLKHLNNYEKYLEKITDIDIKNDIIKIVNKYYFINNLDEIKDIITEEFKNAKLKSPKYENAINEIDIINNLINDDENIYIINFNNEYIPLIHKDTDLISDYEKPNYIEKSYELNNIEKVVLNKVLCNIKNLTITASKRNYTSSLNISNLALENNYEVIESTYEPSKYSNKSNIYNLAILLDKYNKYNSFDKEITPLYSTYPNIEYKKYDNSYKKIIFKEKFDLSYTKMNSYYECSFKYYCDNILKLNKFETTFDTYLGSLCHKILENSYNQDFDFNAEKDKFITDNNFNLTAENKLFLERILSELKDALNYIQSFKNVTKYNDIECEKNIKINKGDTNFIGIIDKVMHYNDNIALIDYKTGNTEINLKLCKYGLNMQLPTYIYLIKSIYPNSKIVGVYLQHILKPKNNKDFNKSDEDIYEDSLKLTGYTLGNESVIKDFDSTYENSEYIKSLKLNQNGFSRYSKVLTETEFEKLEKYTEKTIDKCIENIKKASFDINPKYLGYKNLSCDYCPYKSICFTTDKDNIYLKLDDNLEFLDGDNNE